MARSRRNFLTIVGGGTIIAATGIGGFALTRTPTQALAPWQQAGSYTDPRRYALSYALLAPNPHNRQPWLVDLRTEDTVTLHLDKTRTLPETDPQRRQITIGLGCFLELMTMAAAQSNHAVDFELYPDGEDGPVAVARFSSGASADPLFAQVMDRRSCKEAFEQKPVPENLVLKLSQLATIVTDDDTVAALRDLTFAAWETEAFTPRTLKESVDLMRMGKKAIIENPDGIDLGGAFLESLMLAGILTKENQLDTNSTGFREGVRMYREMLYATPAYAVLTSPANSRNDQIAAGRQWLRLNLTTTALGLSLHPVSQALQEFPEMEDHYNNIHRLLAEPGHTVQMLGRLGYGPAVARSPRWPLDTRILQA